MGYLVFVELLGVLGVLLGFLSYMAVSMGCFWYSGFFDGFVRV